MVIGEKFTLALIDAAASASIGVVEALLNITTSYIEDRQERIKLSANPGINRPEKGVAI